MPVCYVVAIADVWLGSFMSTCSGSDLFLSGRIEMDNRESSFVDYTLAELPEVCHLIDLFEKQEDNESNVEFGSGGGILEGEISSSKHDVPFVALQQTWPPVTLFVT